MIKKIFCIKIISRPVKAIFKIFCTPVRIGRVESNVIKII